MTTQSGVLVRVPYELPRRSPENYLTLCAPGNGKPFSLLALSNNTSKSRYHDAVVVNHEKGKRAATILRARPIGDFAQHAYRDGHLTKESLSNLGRLAREYGIAYDLVDTTPQADVLAVVTVPDGQRDLRINVERGRFTVPAFTIVQAGLIAAVCLSTDRYGVPPAAA